MKDGLFSTVLVWYYTEVRERGMLHCLIVRSRVGDLQVLIAAWGSQADSPGSLNWNPNADCNRDGRVNVEDLQILAANWGRSM